jgi:hypothetical protein
MPMIDFEWSSYEYSLGQMTALAKTLDDDLRAAIKVARPSVDHEYKIMVRGRPQPPIAIGVPMLEFRIDYHEEWRFTDEELVKLLAEMHCRIEHLLKAFDVPVENGKIRLYVRSGYRGADLNTH